jgi:hypothetical protein
MAQKMLAGPNTAYSEKQYCQFIGEYPVHICWDPDARRVWLEPGAGPRDEDIFYCQERCNEWGVHCCATSEDYEQAFIDLDALPYDEVMAEGQDQGVGGIGGISE